MINLPKTYTLTKEVRQALKEDRPIVALESTVITHGLPHPDNIHLAFDMESEVRAQDAVPATIAVLDGKIHIGLEQEELEKLAKGKGNRKISVRDYGPALAQKSSGGTTVAGTLYAAQQVGIQVFATGGIGGVHRNAPFDISADLPQLAKSPVVVVCAGAKAILDLPATLEYLETAGVPVVSYQTDEFPAFYSLESGLPAQARADTPEEIAEIAKAHWGLGFKSAVLVGNPPPEKSALPAAQIEVHIQQALDEAREQNIRGQAVTPFLLGRVSELSGGDSLKANLALLKNNARLAGEIAGHLYERNNRRVGLI